MLAPSREQKVAESNFSLSINLSLCINAHTSLFPKWTFFALKESGMEGGGSSDRVIAICQGKCHFRFWFDEMRRTQFPQYGRNFSPAQIPLTFFFIINVWPYIRLIARFILITFVVEKHHFDILPLL
jgi:hypothetical protein